MKIKAKQPAHNPARFSSVKKAVASIALGVLLAGPMMTGCKKAPVEETSLFTDDAQAAERLISKGADPNVRNNFGETPLLRAASSGNEKIAELLVTHDADTGLRDRNGWTALMWAVSEGHGKIVELLVAHDADVNTKDKDLRTVLMRAASGGRKEIVELLLAKGADPNAVDAFNMTVLKCATVGFTDSNHREIAKMLRENGARE